VNHDLTRQALIVGLRHFAQATNAYVIAEGVETEEERRSLIGLDLMLGQGYLFARPVPAGAHAVISATAGGRPIATAGAPALGRASSS
jgi:EAL domain-containing protein (putative c-di-GMP-specific phosphodiesterase class I)